MKKNIRNILVIVLAVCICAAVGFKASDARLKASEDVPEAETIEEAADEVVEEAAEPEAPAEEPEEVTEVEVDVPAEEEKESEAEEEKAEAEEEKTEAEEVKAEAEEEETEAGEEKTTEAGEEKTTEAEEAAPVEKSISTWFEYEGTPYLGMTVLIRSSIQGYSDDVAYKWQYTTDGANWHDAENGNAATYTFVLNETTCMYKWRLGVYDYDPIVETPAETEAA